MQKVKLNKFANYSPVYKSLRTMRDSYFKKSELEDPILFETKELAQKACDERNSWNPANWCVVPVTIEYEIPE